MHNRSAKLDGIEMTQPAADVRDAQNIPVWADLGRIRPKALPHRRFCHREAHKHVTILNGRPPTLTYLARYSAKGTHAARRGGISGYPTKDMAQPAATSSIGYVTNEVYLKGGRQNKALL